LVVVLSLAASGCLSPGPADPAMNRLILDRTGATPGVTSNAAIDAVAVATRAPAAPPEIDLPSALRLASRHNRELQAQRDSLRRQAIALRATRREYGLSLAGTLGYVISSDDSTDTDSSSLAVSAGHPLPLGGSLSVAASTSLGSYSSGGTNSTESTVSGGIKVRQPLLAGAGYTASHQGLIQAERDTVYAIRAFARNRQSAAMKVVSEFYQLLAESAGVENARLNAQQSTLLRQRTEALFRVQRAPAIDVMRAQQQELAASNRLANAQATFESGRQAFLITLGLSIDAPSAIVGVVPEVQPVPMAEADATRIALSSRLDLQTVRDRAGDAARRLGVARANLLPAVDATGEAGWSADGSRALDTRDGQTTYSAGITLSIPMDRRPERDAVRAARLDLDLAERNAEQAEDEVRLEIASAYRQIAYLAQAAQIEKRTLAIAEKRAENARLRFKNGELENRDVVEAENELLHARNSLAQAQVQYAMQRLRLMQSAGVLDVAPDGSLVTTDGTQGVHK
jgi:outer membrane protein TolC